MNGYCNKCDVYIDELNELEEDEYLTLGSFVCSTCINKEMDKENLKWRIIK